MRWKAMAVCTLFILRFLSKVAKWLSRLSGSNGGDGGLMGHLTRPPKTERGKGDRSVGADVRVLWSTLGGSLGCTVGGHNTMQSCL